MSDIDILSVCDALFLPLLIVQIVLLAIWILIHVMKVKAHGPGS